MHICYFDFNGTLFKISVLCNCKLRACICLHMPLGKCHLLAADVVWNAGSNKDEENKDSDNEGDDITEFTDDELLSQLKGLENTNPKQISLGSTCSGK